MRFLVGISIAVLACGVARADVVSPAEQKVDAAIHRIIEGNYVAAEPLLCQALAQDPGLREAHYNLAVVMRATGRYDQAVLQYQAALEMYPSNDIPNRSKNLYGIALAVEAKGDPRAAAVAWGNYIRFAQRYAAEQPALAIARRRLDGELRAAGLPPARAPQTSSRTQHRQ